MKLLSLAVETRRPYRSGGSDRGVAQPQPGHTCFHNEPWNRGSDSDLIWDQAPEPEHAVINNLLLKSEESHGEEEGRT